MKMKKITFLFFIIVLVAVFIHWSEILGLYSELFSKMPRIEKVITDFSLKDIEKEVLTPGPFRASRESQQSFLTKAGIVQWTNFQREENGLVPLSENTKLNAVAVLKLRDMFEKQYFAHISPSGTGAADIVKEIGYEFVATGENLALGNFEDDKELVQGWMDSPGHRENILGERYQEIGVAVGKGIFEGESTWLAVQIFGLPLSACPQPDKNLKVKIELYQSQLEELQKKIGLLQAEIKAMHPKRGPAYNQKIREYNELVKQYNNLVEQIRTSISEYNSQIALFNECAK